MALVSMGSLSTIRPQMNSLRNTSSLHFKGDSPRIISEEIIKRDVAQRPRTAILTDRHHVFYFQRKTSGRLCACTQNERVKSPLSCPLCYGVGLTGGYNKLGTVLEMLDTTCFMATQGLDLKWSERPRFFELLPGVKEGFATWTIELQSNLRQLDVFQTIVQTYEGNFQTLVNGSETPDWASLLAEPRLTFTVKLSRRNPAHASPKFWGLFFRYKTGNTTYLCDVPKDEANISLQDLGIYDFRVARHFYFTNEILNVSTKDFVYEHETQKAWKIVQRRREAPLGNLMAWEVDSRVVQSYEPMSIYPVGS